MKKLFCFAVAATILVGCSNEELNVQDNVQKASQEAPVRFDVYAQRSVTRGGTPNDITNANIGEMGFGVFAYYTAGEKYDTKATPNFMYNQKVVSKTVPTEGEGAGLAKWTYEPVKYWPNEFGNAAISDEIDYVTFFSYAPWTNIEPTTGEVDVTGITDEALKAKAQNYNIISVNKNSASGDPIIKYVVDTDPSTSVDLLWGVAAPNNGYSEGIGGNKVTIESGKPFVNLVKPNDPVNDLIRFNLKHALAKVKVTIDYIADQPTPSEGTTTTASTTASATINANETRIFVRSFTLGGFATKGALNLNNTTAGEPLWKDFDGVKDLTFDDVTFFDGRRDSKEGDVNGIQYNETPQGLNPNIIENYCATTTANGKTIFADGKNPGVTAEEQLLFGGVANANNGYFYVIPRNNKKGEPVNISIVYDVETIDPNLASTLSDGVTKGLSIENIISKRDIFQGVDFEAGKQYEIKIHIGMTSVKVDAYVSEWVDNDKTTVNLPYNQDERYNFASYADASGNTLWGYGEVLATGVVSGDYSQVKVLTNLPSNTLIGTTCWVKTAGNGRKLLYADANGTAMDPAIYVEAEKVTKYTFTSYGSNETNAVVWATGSVETASVKNVPYNGYQAVKVLANSQPGYINKTYYVESTATGTAKTQLYVEKSGALEATADPAIWVTFATATP